MWSVGSQKCYTPLKNVGNDSSYICRPCRDNKNDPPDNTWYQFFFADDYFPDDKPVPSKTQSNSDLDTSNSMITGKFQ